MSDGVNILDAAGAKVEVATDDCGTDGQAQLVKLAYSADGVATAVTADANGLEIQGAGTAGTAAGGVVSVQGVASGTVIPVSDGGGALTVDGTVAVTNAGITSIDGKITACDTGSIAGTVTANLSATDNAVLDNIDTDLTTIAGDTTSLDGKVTACDTGAVVLAAGTAEIGKLAAGSANIGDVDVASMPTDTFAADAQAYGKGVLVQGDDGTDRRAILVGTDGHVQVDVLAAPSTAVTNADITSCKTALELLDNSVDGNYLNVNANIAGTDFVGGAGAVAAGVQRVTLASDDPAVASLGNLDNAVDGNYLNVNANIAGTDFVGGAGAVAAGVQRVTLASDDPAVASLGSLDNAVDGNYLNVNLNIAGTDVAANAGVLNAQTQRVTIATDDECNNLLGTIDADTSVLAGAVSATHMQCDIVGALPAGTAAIGKLAANSGVDIGDVDVTSMPDINGQVARDAAISGDPVTIGGTSRALASTTPPTAVNADGDSVDMLCDRQGMQYVHPHGHYILSGIHAEAAEAHTDTEVIAAVANLCFHITDIVFSTDTDNTTLKVETDTASAKTALTPTMQFKAGGGCALHFVTPLRGTVSKNIGFTTVTSHTGGILISGYYAP